MSSLDHHHNVYVILLDDAVALHPSVLRLNPKRDPSKPCVYVGMTGLPVEHRFENHKHGYKSAWTVRKYGIRLLPELFEHLNPMPYEAAAQMEKDLAEELRSLGYSMTGGMGDWGIGIQRCITTHNLCFTLVGDFRTNSSQ